MPRLDSQSIREELPATSATVYLNTGSWGPLPRRSAAAMDAAAASELQAGRISGGMPSFLTYFDELAAPLFWVLSANLAAAAGFFFLLYFLTSPRLTPTRGWPRIRRLPERD